ncbi:MAG: cell wall hydrolase [Vitreimonas sp.]
MAARWVGLSRPNTKKSARAVAKQGVMRGCLHALGASSMLLMAAAMNFALYPEALAAVVGGEHTVVAFVPTEPAATPAAPAAETVAVDEAEVRLLAATAWGEARSEGPEGMRAVAHVMVNRVGARFGEDLATVILSPKQFSVWNRGDPNRRTVMALARDPSRVSTDAQWDDAERIAREVLAGQSVDPTGGALFYHTRAVRPAWGRQGRGRQVIGAHVFYADVPDPGTRPTPRLVNVAQYLGQPVSARPEARAQRVSGVIELAPAAPRQPLPSETAALTSLPAPATTTMAANEPIATATPVSMSTAP